MKPETHTLHGADGAFAVELYAVADPVRTVVFAAGRGGSPSRHRGLLDRLAKAGFTVIAPHFDMIAAQAAMAEDLRIRLDRIEEALDTFAPPGVPLIGAGHSIGATLLLVLAGAEAWTLSRERVSVVERRDFRRLLLLAPPTGFFQGPGALDKAEVPVTVWAGTHDAVTPFEQARFLKDVMGDRVEVRLAEGAGHFTFMDELPPGVADPHPDRPAFLSALADDMCLWVRDA
jgi:pimeloyl-ACP methyl ester carboxylesterase